MKKKRTIYVKNPKRAFCSIFVLVLLLAVVITAVFADEVVAGRQEPSFERYTVENGDTLWSIAEDFNTKNKDVRKVIHDIKVENGMMGDSSIQIGQTLYVPVY